MRLLFKVLVADVALDEPLRNYCLFEFGYPTSLLGCTIHYLNINLTIISAIIVPDSLDAARGLPLVLPNLVDCPKDGLKVCLQVVLGREKVANHYPDGPLALEKALARKALRNVSYLVLHQLGQLVARLLALVQD